MANFNTGLTKQQIITALTKALESMSEQEVQSAISSAISGKQDELTFDNTPTSGSNNPVKSGGIYTDQQRQDTEIGTKITLAEAYGLGTVIPQNSDLNAYTAIGSYYAQSSSIAASLSNCPASYTFRLEVKTTNSESRYLQTIYEVIPSGSSAGLISIYRRCYTASGWGAWYKFEGAQVAAVQSAHASLMQAGRLDAELTDDTDNDVSETSVGEEMR